MPSIPLLATKLYIPSPREEAVARPRLVAHLERGKTRPLTLVSAPAGFGKTTLVSSWARGGVCASWVSLDEGDNDPARFWLYVLAALQTHHPTLGQEVFALLQTAQPPVADLIISLLINELAALPEPLTLILDDYHVIENQEIHKGLMFLLDHLPAQLRLLLATRGDPPFALARLRARGQLTEIRIADLAFNADETKVLFNETMGLEICEEDVAALETRTEGWAAGLQLAALSLQGKQDVRGFIQAFTGSHAYIVDYLAEDVLHNQPEAVQTFLLQTSILAQMNASLCDAVTGRADSTAMLEHLRQKNLFVIALDETRQWYRYHHLFAEVLRHRLQTSPGLVGVAELHARASRWFEQANLIEEAIRHAFSAQDLARAIMLIETYGENWTRRGENQTVHSWLQQIPEPDLLAHPRLCIIYALVLHWMHRLEEAYRYLDAAEQGIAPTQPHLKGQVFATRAFLALRQGQYDHTLALIEQAFALIPPDDPNLMGRLKLAYGIALFWKDNHSQAAEAFEEATRLARQAEDWHTALYAMADYALMFSLRGQFRNAEKFFLQAVEFAVTYHMEYSLSANIVYGHLVDLGHEWNDFVLADRYLEKSFKRSEIDQDPARKIDILFKAIKKELTLRRFSDAARLIQACRELVEAHPHPEFIPYDLDYLQVRSWLLQGDLPSALAWVKALNLLAEDEVNTIREPLYIGLARILIASGEPARAVSLLQRLIALAESVGRIWIQVELRGLMVLALSANGQNEEAHQLLDEALALAEPEGYIGSWVDAGEGLRPLIQTLRTGYIQQGKANMVQYTDCLLFAFDHPGVPCPETDAVPPHVSPPAAQPLPERLIESLSEPLSEREQEILRFIDAGLSNREIADKLYISVSTVKTHINNLYAKLDANSRTQALAIARKLGLFSG